ncbi:MAG: methionine adenosyltransferase [Coriobacteriales bacterium]|nr:methionine adenosyltransferase [Coriobacteriales bacterium]
MDDRPSFVFSSESVTEGHPDKVCDQIADAVLDAVLSKEAQLESEGYVSGDGQRAELARVRSAIEVMATEGQVFLAGEMRTQAYIDIDSVVREVVRDIGYVDPDLGFHCRSIGITNSVHEQSADIAQGVDESFEAQHERVADDPYGLIGAGDQGMVFGYACTETPTLMPLPIFLAHRLAEQLTTVRKDGTLAYLRPDGKVQVGVLYEDGRPQRVVNVLVSTQHAEGVSIEGQMRADLEKQVIAPIFERYGVVWKGADVYVNPTGRFVLGGPAGDTGLTGRKIIVDTYGGMARHGGGAFSGKDCTKVDRSASYAARWVAKNVVAAGLAERCEIQVSYGIGMAEPLSLMVEAFGTNTVSAQRLEAAVRTVFDLRPAALIDALDLRRPLFRSTSNYGHFGRELAEFTWEARDKVQALTDAV